MASESSHASPTSLPRTVLVYNGVHVSAGSSGSDVPLSRNQSRESDAYPPSPRPVSPPDFCRDLTPLDMGMYSYWQLKRLERSTRELLRDPDAPRRSRRPFYAAEKKKVCETYIANPGITHQKLADMFRVNKSMITRTLMKKSRWLASEHTPGYQIARRSNLRFDDIEDELDMWLKDCTANDIPVTDACIKKRAFTLAAECNMLEPEVAKACWPAPFKCGRTWLRNFKERWGIVHGQVTGFGLSEKGKIRKKAIGAKHPSFYSPPASWHINSILVGLQKLKDAGKLNTEPEHDSDHTSPGTPRSSSCADSFNGTVAPLRSGPILEVPSSTPQSGGSLVHAPTPTRLHNSDLLLREGRVPEILATRYGDTTCASESPETGIPWGDSGPDALGWHVSHFDDSGYGRPVIPESFVREQTE